MDKVVRKSLFLLKRIINHEDVKKILKIEFLNCIKVRKEALWNISLIPQCIDATKGNKFAQQYAIGMF